MVQRSISGGCGLISFEVGQGQLLGVVKRSRPKIGGQESRTLVVGGSTGSMGVTPPPPPLAVEIPVQLFQPSTAECLGLRTGE